jgi:exopolysaccharide biosynthesis polyprenyl glycosylphosphotransferase
LSGDGGGAPGNPQFYFACDGALAPTGGGKAMTTEIHGMARAEAGPIPLAARLTARADDQGVEVIALPPRAAVTGLPLAPHRVSNRTQRWQRLYTAAIVALDAAALLLGALAGQLTRFDSLDGTLGGVDYYEVVLVATAGWVLAMAASRTYETSCTGLGSEEFRRVGNAAARFTALLAIVVYLLHWDVARGLVVVALPMTTLATLGFRFLARKVLHRIRSTGQASHRVLVVGCGPSRVHLTQRLQANSYCGLRVVGECSPLVTSGTVAPSLSHVRALAERLDADTVAVAHSSEVTADVLRRMAWSLEGSGINLLVAPALTDVAGPRINIRPVSGLPLLQIAEPEFTGAGRVVKGVIDLLGSLALLIVLSPLMLPVAVAIRMTSAGPVLFRQTRIGRGGKPFTILKFRTMHVDAEEQLATLRDLNDHGDGILFKLRDDPRITPTGRRLRRFSIDELPQLFNVLRGQMSLVGPRPPLPSEVERYEQHVHRRLLVKPGLTGLWQVSGRSDLDWQETVRLDLYYVENWAVSLDAEILWKTLRAVLHGSGAR